MGNIFSKLLGEIIILKAVFIAFQKDFAFVKNILNLKKNVLQILVLSPRVMLNGFIKLICTQINNLK